MNGIIGFTDLLQQPDLSGNEQQKYIDIIKKSGNRMLNTVNDIIDISRIEAGLEGLTISEVNVSEQLNYLYSFFKPEAEKKGIILIFKNENPEKDTICKTDADKFSAILTNLIKNAIKYTNKGSIEFGYNIEDGSGFSELKFYIIDTGIGIPKNRQQAIFDRFVQADIEDTQAKQGSGLGLAISKAYAEMMGGKIWLDSEEGKGSTFYFTIKNNHVSKITSIYKKDNQPIIKGENTGGNLNILVVEDDETSQHFISIVVEKYAKTIKIVNTGLEAVEVCQNNADIDLILMDIQLPGMNGYKATQQIRKFNKDVIIIAQTAYALTGDKEKAISAGCNDYISKPIDQSELGLLIKKYWQK
jgi:CheY-like chemotaxis protein